ncbi:thiamine pyrophosphate-binding protein, partial [Pseudomonas aeruginosa]|nr:thiamine pyrophosphate-binding protein [Pseudomonas aeruginosa]
LIHVHPDSAELNRVYLARLPIQATPCAFAEALADLAPLPSSTWQDWREAAHADYLAYSTPAASDPAVQGVDLASVVAYLSENLPDDAVIANGAGNYAVWVHRFYRYRQARTQLAPTNGAMGY